MPKLLGRMYLGMHVSWDACKSAPFTGAIRAMAMTIGCDLRAINGEAKACAGAALILGGLLLLIAP
jgi:hypothetical protein